MDEIIAFTHFAITHCHLFMTECNFAKMLGFNDFTTSQVSLCSL